jgi:hypothetical protein
MDVDPSLGGNRQGYGSPQSGVKRAMDGISLAGGKLCCSSATIRHQQREQSLSDAWVDIY